VSAQAIMQSGTGLCPTGPTEEYFFSALVFSRMNCLSWLMLRILIFAADCKATQVILAGTHHGEQAEKSTL